MVTVPGAVVNLVDDQEKSQEIARGEFSVIKLLQAEVKPSVRNSNDSEIYWSDVAPKVKDYHNILAKGIAAGTGQIIKGIFLCSNAYSTTVKNGGEFLRSHLKAAEEEPNSDHDKMKKTKKSSACYKILKAIHLAGKDAFKTTSKETTEVVTHRFGEDAGETTRDTLAIVGHAIEAGVHIAVPPPTTIGF
ncbi:hypothetical protein KI387_025760 [Taxus chinensis]|uniref:Senescence domain-containing protein n=1 Tax=Taxus chinensis TaxID=29808 RepID=A0AA38FW25_TAXCH|nr:hypothetical protein KI387_025760 [Taxus chinensis]